MQFLTFAEKSIDSFARMQLVDLARTLTQVDQTKIEFSFHSFFNAKTKTIGISQFWEDYTLEDRMVGMKSDVYLRSIGSAWYSDALAIKQYLEEASVSQLPQLAKQLFAFCEDIRLEQLCIRHRPGTARIFARRRELYTKYFMKRIKGHMSRNEDADALFVSLYLWFSAKQKVEEIPHSISTILNIVAAESKGVLTSESTAEVGEHCKQMMLLFRSSVTKDMVSRYFTTHETNGITQPTHSSYKEELQRGHLSNNDTVNTSRDDDIEKYNESLPTWHRETKELSNNFMQFELERGSRTDMMSGTVREAESGDQAMALVHGSAQFSRKNDFSNHEELMKQLASIFVGKKDEFGEANQSAKALFTFPNQPHPENIEEYRRVVEEIDHYKRSLIQTIQKTLELKQTAIRSDLSFGRLSKKLLRIYTDRNPKLFYKKSSSSNQIDAAFLLLVDCSASMFDKMEKTKKGITLFHETLRTLQIAHSIVGFWEDSDEAKQEDIPNVFHMIIDFASSQYKKCGPHIVQLAPQQDNRDGFAIRIMTRYLLKRAEKQRVLLVFSDGAPAASDYSDNGILDTYQAVLEARRQGVEVINIFLSNGEVNESEQKTMHTIYGRHSVNVPEVAELSQHLIPLLRKLLSKMI